MDQSERPWLGLHRAPILTLAVWGITLAGNLAQAAAPGMLALCERTPAARHEIYRLFTAMLVQDGGLAGGLSNLAFLLALGALVEQFVVRWAWLLCYVATGLAGELAGLLWQPTGAGNSVAICGLAGLLAVLLWMRALDLPRAAPVILAYWALALLVSGFPGGLLLWLVVAVVTPRLVAGRRRRDRAVTVGVAVVAVSLCAAANLHGAALAAGLVLGAVIAPRGVRQPLDDLPPPLTNHRITIRYALLCCPGPAERIG